MPNRIIKESIRTSYEIDDLSFQAESTFYRLLTFADDYGRFPSDERVLISQLFPLKSSVRSKDFSSWISELVSVNLISLYVGKDGKPYGFFNTWEDHQQVRSKRSKYPEPKGELYSNLSEQFNAVKLKRNQMISDDIKCTRNPIQSNPNPIQSESESNSNVLSVSDDDIEALYKLYPRKVGKGAAIKAIRSAIKERESEGVENPLGYLTQKVVQFAESPAGNAGNYTPHPSTWFNQQRYLDDPTEWQNKSNQKNNGSNTSNSQFHEFAEALDELEDINTIG